MDLLIVLSIVLFFGISRLYLAGIERLMEY